ncbi:uncharacterized protein K489DRAFT_138 [Dissoconium aciculare CBS 342.82]|uniref:Uncharacterized protein n=1 Tax=Dissoconium aciculare CBS 342.82 TaxID=1314786 RepID=A0A6J3MGP8_9PEZI|nr:uncharacterized protein K489DRAFT_138 [Dissoconium aciculare CBS 342.82]KAF1826854.1 hypothetical protein K489DRAFT_138 [Dissoconium aciculare CBS 342.82]
MLRRAKKAIQSEYSHPADSLKVGFTPLDRLADTTQTEAFFYAAIINWGGWPVCLTSFYDKAQRDRSFRAQFWRWIDFRQAQWQYRGDPSRSKETYLGALMYFWRQHGVETFEKAFEDYWLEDWQSEEDSFRDLAHYSNDVQCRVLTREIQHVVHFCSVPEENTFEADQLEYIAFETRRRKRQAQSPDEDAISAARVKLFVNHPVTWTMRPSVITGTSMFEAKGAAPAESWGAGPGARIIYDEELGDD